jgi:hypothetical protein
MSLNAKQSLVGNVSAKGKLVGSATFGKPLATVEVSEIEGGHKITITDPNGVQELTIMDGKGETAKIGEVTLLGDKWVGDASPYSQVVSIDGVTENSQVDLTPSAEQLSAFWEKDIAFVTENVAGVVTVYCIGQKPQNDYTMQVTITEVAYE